MLDGRGFCRSGSGRPDAWPRAPRGPLVVAGRTGARGDAPLRRLAVAPRLTAHYGSGGMKSGTAGANLDVAVTPRRVLVVTQALGGATTLTFTHRFRWDPRVRRFALVGEDSENGAPANRRTLVSTNSLTGARVVTRYSDRAPAGHATRSRVAGPAEFLGAARRRRATVAPLL